MIRIIGSVSEYERSDWQIREPVERSEAALTITTLGFFFLSDAIASFPVVVAMTWKPFFSNPGTKVGLPALFPSMHSKLLLIVSIFNRVRRWDNPLS